MVGRDAARSVVRCPLLQIQRLNRNCVGGASALLSSFDKVLLFCTPQDGITAKDLCSDKHGLESEQSCIPPGREGDSPNAMQAKQCQTSCCSVTVSHLGAVCRGAKHAVHQLRARVAAPVLAQRRLSEVRLPEQFLSHQRHCLRERTTTCWSQSRLAGVVGVMSQNHIPAQTQASCIISVVQSELPASGQVHLSCITSALLNGYLDPEAVELPFNWCLS